MTRRSSAWRWILGVLALSLAGQALPQAARAIPEEVPNKEAEEAARRAKDLAGACASNPCRTETRDIRLNDINGGSYDFMTELLPYVDDGAVSLYSGETVEIDFAADGKAMDRPRFVRTVEDKAAPGAPPPADDAQPDQPARGAMRFQLKQTDGKADMTLEIKSDLGFIVKYDAVIFVPTPNGIKTMHTSSCPVISHGAGFETWPYPIMMIVLTDFRVLSADGKDYACR
jgi:hypothetical protein